MQMARNDQIHDGHLLFVIWVVFGVINACYLRVKHFVELAGVKGYIVLVVREAVLPESVPDVCEGGLVAG